MKVSPDKYELPIAVADSPRELARMTGNTRRSISSMISKSCKGWCKVWIDEEDGNAEKGKNGISLK